MANRVSPSYPHLKMHDNAIQLDKPKRCASNTAIVASPISPPPFIRNDDRTRNSFTRPTIATFSGKHQASTAGVNQQSGDWKICTADHEKLLEAERRRQGEK